MEQKYFIATLLFGKQPVIKKVNAIDANEAIQIINEYYDHAQVIGLFSLDEVDEIKDLLKENDNIFFINEIIFNPDEIQYKFHIEKNRTIEEVDKHYENRMCSILDSEDMVKLITTVYHWLSNDGMNSIPLQKDFLE
jgi:hypothetical protein